MNKTRNFLAIAVILVLILFLSYTVVIVSKPKTVILQGQVEATQIKIASKLVGRIDSLGIKKGQLVEAGQVLFTLNSPEIEAKLKQAMAGKQAAMAQSNKAQNGAQDEDIQAAYNSYQKAVAAAELSRKTYTRVNNLFKEGVVPEQKKDEAETQMIAAQETANAAKALWEKAKGGARSEDKTAAYAIVNQANGVISEVESYMSERIITAPITGEIANIISEQGELVPSGFPVVTIVDLDDIWVTFNMREDLLSKIKIGTIIEASFPALNMQKVKLKVNYINPLGSYAT
ncbi:MAG: efflux RND transporter periplasmic adaptor subunit, partial [Bacteroidales bacterium]|nr:efflux RND transporter periplasmic adaptor subunit [Bacteroidales bacterium]